MRKGYVVMLVATVMALSMASTPAHADETDRRIESSAKKSYNFKTYLKDDHIKVDSKDGVVTLKGSVNEPSHRSLAQDTVEGLPDVKSVVNDIEVKGYDKEGNPTDKDHSDAWIATKVRTALLFHRSVSLRKTDVKVKDGVVVLTGSAENQAEKDLASEYAKDIEGVKSVQNDMSVAETVRADERSGAAHREGERIDDASITAEVKSTLLVHRSTSAVRTKVVTRDGVVTLTGTAKNTAEKDLVSKLVGDIDGVKKVDNQMAVE